MKNCKEIKGRAWSIGSVGHQLARSRGVDVQEFAIHLTQVSEEAISPPFIQSYPHEDLWSTRSDRLVSPHRAYAESLVRDAKT